MGTTTLHVTYNVTVRREASITVEAADWLERGHNLIQEELTDRGEPDVVLQGIPEVVHVQTPSGPQHTTGPRRWRCPATT